MRKTSLLLPGLTAAVLLALAPACGSGGGDTPPPTTAPPPPVTTPPPVTPPPDPGPTTVDLTQFARTLVQQDTSDTAKPRELGGITFTDAEDPNTFGDDFFTPQ